MRAVTFISKVIPGVRVHFPVSAAANKNITTSISVIPEIEVHVMDNEQKADCVGEPGLPPFTSALTNAIFDLTGTDPQTPVQPGRSMIQTLLFIIHPQ